MSGPTYTSSVPRLRDYPWLPDWFENGFNAIARRGWLPIVAIGLATLAMWGFFALAGEVTEHDTRAFDEHVFTFIASRYDSAPPFWQEAGRDLTALGGVTTITLITAGVTLFLVFRKQWKGAMFVLVSVLGGLAISLLLKEFFNRDRPALFDHRSHTMTASFPSGHSSNSAVAYLTMAILLAKLVDRPTMKAYIFAVGLLIPILVGFSRVFLGVHWPTDVIAGWLLGLAWGLIVWGVATFLQRRGQIEQEGKTTEGNPVPAT